MGHLLAVRSRQRATDELFEPLKETIMLLESYGQKMPEQVYAQLEVSAHEKRPVASSRVTPSARHLTRKMNCRWKLCFHGTGKKTWSWKRLIFPGHRGIKPANTHLCVLHKIDLPVHCGTVVPVTWWMTASQCYHHFLVYRATISLLFCSPSCLQSEQQCLEIWHRCDDKE